VKKKKLKNGGGRGEKVFPCMMPPRCSQQVCLSQKPINTATPGILFHQFPVLMSAVGGFLLYNVIHSPLPL